MLTEQPRRNQRIAFRSFTHEQAIGEAPSVGGDLHSFGTVTRIEGNLCWAKWDAGGVTEPFIWRHATDGTLNTIAEIVPGDGDVGDEEIAAGKTAKASHATAKAATAKKRPRPRPFACAECRRRFTAAGADRAMSAGCPACNGGDIQLLEDDAPAVRGESGR